VSSLALHSSGTKLHAAGFDIMLEITLGPDKPVAIRIMIVVSVFLFIALVAAGLRIPARRFAHEKLDFSDYSAFLALVSGVYIHPFP
jgi:hypothetical protein